MRMLPAALAAFGLSGCISASSHRAHPMTSTEARQEAVVAGVVRESEPVPHARAAASLKISLVAAIDTALGQVKGQARARPPSWRTANRSSRCRS